MIEPIKSMNSCPNVVQFPIFGALRAPIIEETPGFIRGLVHFGVQFPFSGALRALNMKETYGFIRDLGYFWDVI